LTIRIHEPTSSNDTTSQEWVKVRFDAIAENIVEHVEVPSESGYDRFVGGDHLDPGSLKISRWGSTNDVEAQKLLFKKGHILFGKRNAYLRKVAYADFDGVCSAHMLVLQAKSDYILEEFLPFFMQTDQFWERALMISEGSMSPTIKWKTLAQQEFVIPPKDEQRRIADILQAADETIITWDKVVQESVVLLNTLINASISNNQDDRLVKLQEVCTRITDGTHLPPQFAQQGIPFLLVSNLASGKIDWNVSKWITEETYRELTKRMKPEFGDVLYTVVGSYGVPVLITWDQPFAFQRHIAILKPKKGVLDGAYLTYFLKSSLGKKQAELSAVGNAQKTITLGSLSNFEIPIPPLGKQKQIVERINEVNTAIVLASQHSQISKQLKSEALKQLVWGE
jgi:type I restriction enzyme S subunit